MYTTYHPQEQEWELVEVTSWNGRVTVGTSPGPNAKGQWTWTGEIPTGSTVLLARHYEAPGTKQGTRKEWLESSYDGKTWHNAGEYTCTKKKPKK